MEWIIEASNSVDDIEESNESNSQCTSWCSSYCGSDFSMSCPCSLTAYQVCG